MEEILVKHAQVSIAIKSNRKLHDGKNMQANVL